MLGTFGEVRDAKLLGALRVTSHLLKLKLVNT